MKKRTIALIAILLAALLAACTEKTGYNTLLVRADSLMNLHPDSALHILESIAADSLKTRADRACHALLLTQARDKNYIVQADDSLIRTAVRYYDAHKDAAMQARAYYLWAGVYRDMNHCGEAINAYHQAADYAQKAKEEVLLGRIYNSAGYIYLNQGLKQNADSVFQLAEHLAMQQQDSCLWAEVMALRGRIQMESGTRNYKSAEQMMLRALSIAYSIKNKRIETGISATLSILYSRMNAGEKSLCYAKRYLMSQTDTSSNWRSFMLLGNAYFKMKEYDSATIYLHKGLINNQSHGIKSDIYMRLADIAKIKGNLESSIEYERLHSAYNDSIYQTKQDKEIIQAEKRLQATEQHKITHAFQSIRNIATIVSIALLILLYATWKYRRRMKISEQSHVRSESERQKLSDIYKRTKSQLQIKEQEIISLQKKLEQLNSQNIQKESLKKELDELITKRNALTKDAYEHSGIHFKMKQIIQECRKQDKSEYSLDDNDWQQLIAETDIRWENITLRLREHYNLTEEDIRICCLYLTDFPTSHLQYILQCSRDSVYRKGYVILEEKMGLSRKDTSLKEFLKGF